MKILVVEDEQRIAMALKRGLELKSHTVDVALDGEEGYGLASTEPYDVIILDQMLPKRNGLEICKQLRVDSVHTPILMLTAKTEINDRVAGLDAGADDYLAKPFAFEELHARIRALVRRPQQSVMNVIQVGSLILNLQNYTVSRSGVPIDLSKKEFALLEFFMRHPNQVFSKEQLTEQVWSFDSDVLPNTAQVYIGYLRAKIDGPFDNEPPLFRTVRGFGYTFGQEI